MAKSSNDIYACRGPQIDDPGLRRPPPWLPRRREPSQPSGAPPLHLWGLGARSSRFARKKFPAAFSLRVKKFPVAFLLGVNNSQFVCWSGVKVPGNRGVSRGFWRVFSWPWPASWLSELPSSRNLMFSQRRPAPPSPVVGILQPRHDDTPTLYCKVFGGVGEGASVSRNCSELMGGCPAASVGEVG